MYAWHRRYYMVTHRARPFAHSLAATGRMSGGNNAAEKF